MKSGDFLAIPDVAEAEAETLLSAARSLDEAPVRQAASASTPTPATRAPEPAAGPELLERAAKYLASMPEAVEGAGGSDATYAAAAALAHGFGLSESDALALLLADFNPRCVPPWTEAELAHKVRDAATKPHDQPRGYLRDRPAPGAAQPSWSATIGQASGGPTTKPRPARGTPPAPPAAFIPYPLHLLPGPFAKLAREAAKSIGADPAAVAGPLLVAAGAVIGSTTVLARSRTWKFPPTLWMATVAYTGERKSAPRKEALKSLRTLDKARREIDAEAAADYEAERLRYELELAAWKKEPEGRPPRAPDPSPIRAQTVGGRDHPGVARKALAQPPRADRLCG